MSNTYLLLVVVVLTVCCLSPCSADVGVNCTGNSDCTGSGEYCNGTISQCACLSSHYQPVPENMCEPKGNNGGNCTYNVDSCLYPGQLVCQSNNTCSCADTTNTYWDSSSNTCKPKGNNGGNCTYNVDSCLYPGQLVCQSNNTCSCADTTNTYWDSSTNTCKPKGNNGGNCKYNVDSCLYPGQLVCQSNNTCSCADTTNNYWDSSSNTCKPKGNNGGNCKYNVDSCLYPGQLVCQSNNTCSCADTTNTYWDSSTNTCKPKGNNGGNCKYNVDSCLYPGQLVCQSNNTCSCADTTNTYWDSSSNTCKPKGNNGGNCKYNVDSCLYPGQLVCQSNNTCSCADTTNNYWDSSSNTCKPKGNNGGNCKYNVDSCLYPGQLVCQSNNTCSCADTTNNYWDSSSNTCKPKGNNGGNCKYNVDSCLYPGQLVCQSNNTCSCADTTNNYWDSSSNTCKPKGNNGGNCKYNVDSCLYPGQLVCQSNNTCSCADTTNNYWDSSSNTCKPKGNNGGNCKYNVDSCLYPGQLVCQSDNTCSCADTTNNYWDSSSNTCKPKKALGSACNADVECLVDNSECDTKCQCKSSYFDTNNAATGGSCKDLNLLKVLNIQLESRSETFLVLTWDEPADKAAIEEYRVKTIGSSHDISTGKTNKANVTGLVQGRSYTVQIISVDTNSRPDTQTTTVTGNPQSTIPAAPGPLELATSDLDAADKYITIRWQKTGDVQYYTVSINPTLQQTSLSGESVTYYDAKNGYRYTLNLTAHSNGLNSTEYSELFRTLITKPNPPTSLSCSDIGSTLLDLHWQEPLIPNGDIMYYLVNTVYGPSPPPQINTTTNVQRYTIEGLVEASTYSFNVQTVNDGNENIRTSFASNTISCTTKAGLSSIPTNTTATMVSSRSINVSWRKPVNTKGDLFGYRLRLFKDTSCVKEIIFQCTDCSNVQSIPDTNMCGVIAETENVDTVQMESPFIHTITQLLPYTEYTVKLTAYNAAGDGDKEEVKVWTDSEKPQKPVTLSVTVNSATEITVTWNQPTPRPGVTKYTVKAYEVVNGSQPVFVKFSNVTGFDTRTTKFTGLEAYWNYTFNVVATTDKGDSPSSDMSIEVRTKQAVPGKVRGFKAEGVVGNYTVMKVVWSIPALREQNGVIKEYRIEHNITGVLPTTVPADSDSLLQYYSVKPETNYQITIYAVNTENTTGEISELDYDALPGPPNTPDIEVIDKEINKPVTTQTTITIRFSLNWFQNTDNGHRTDGGIILCPAGSCTGYGESSGTTKDKGHFMDTNYILTWKLSKAEGFSKPFRVTNTTWIESYENGGRRRRSSDGLVFVIGEETDCDSKDDTAYCNGPLPPATSFMVVAFVCSNGGCTESEPIGPLATQKIPDDDFPIAIVAGAVAAVVVAFIVIIIVIVIVRARRGPKHKKMPDEKEPEDIGVHVLETPSVERKNIKLKRPVRMREFAAKVEELHKDSNLKFAHEYEELKVLTDPKTMKGVTSNLAESEQNKLKNRYVNILPYDQTIVKLLPLIDDDGDDTTFINANYIPGYSSQREYIATQGPIPSTIDDFWRMVWEQNVSIIVMLTLCKEDGRIKCECYFPMELNEVKQYGDLVVETSSCSTINTYDFRIFKFSMGDKTRTVKHFHFFNWRDFSADVKNDVLVDFIANVRSHMTVQESHLPMIVHCSAGVGRTGTFIAVDHMMQFIADHDWNATIDIFDLVHRMRKCRNFMVQTEQQYIFIHDCVKDLLDKKKKKEQADEENIYVNNGIGEENIYENKAFDAEEPSLYSNVQIGQRRTDL